MDKMREDCRECDKYSFDYNSSSFYLLEFCDGIRFNGPLSDGEAEKLCERDN